MQYLILLSILLLAWMVSISSYRFFLMDRKPTLIMNSMFDIFPPNLPYPHRKIEREDRGLPSEIKQDLYNSISTGMSYNEVRAIVGWDGILIYENDINTAQGQIREKVYQWNHEDIYDTQGTSQNPDNANLYWSVTLQFQNDILIKKSSSNLQP
jgi:hypothetical protein